MRQIQKNNQIIFITLWGTENNHYNIHTIYTLNEHFTSGYSTIVLDLLSLVAILFAILVITSKNPIVSVLFLIGLFSAISVYLIMLGMSFIGLSYLLVYVGAISILFLFILMLINVRVSELTSNTSNSIFTAILLGLLFNYTVYQIVPYSLSSFNGYNSINKNSTENALYINQYGDRLFALFDSNNLNYVTSSNWDSNLSEISHISAIGNIMYANYSIWLIITSFILLLAMVGTIVITINQDNATSSQKR